LGPMSTVAIGSVEGCDSDGDGAGL
jgi:hypothetical protein